MSTKNSWSILTRKMAAQILRFAVRARSLSLPSHLPSTLVPTRRATNSATGAFLPEPEKQSYGLLGVTGTMLFGLFVGATISQNIASFLEENELFVPSDDDDDDD